MNVHVVISVYLVISDPIRRCLFIDYIINDFMPFVDLLLFICQLNQLI